MWVVLLTRHNLVSRVDCVTLSGNLLLLRLWLRSEGIKVTSVKNILCGGREEGIFCFCFIRLTAPTIISDTLVTRMAEGAG